MSRTFRKQPSERRNERLGTAGPGGPHAFLGTIRDGQQTWRKLVRRDSRVTGLREHKLHRTRTRQQLQSGDEGAVTAGKTRRYGDTYGAYEL